MTKLLLLTNDDGVHAPGLRALSEALGELGEVHVVAPDREVSACSQSLTLKNPLRAAQLAERVHAVEGTPADCVNLAVAKLLPRRPDVVVSGINRGANLGDDVFYSGTVGGAREACFHGLPALAFSLAVRNGETPDYRHAASEARGLVQRVLEHGLPVRTLLNVNVPPGKPLGIKVTVQAPRDHVGLVLAGLDARSAYLRGEEERGRERRDETADIEAVRRGLVSVTPLHTDTTHHSALDALRAWEDERDPAVAIAPRSW